MEDLIDQANEIQESLGRSYGVPDEIDESDLQAGESTRFLAFHVRIEIARELTVSSLFSWILAAELDALADEGYAEEESEGQLPSYLRDSSTHALPDFVDSDPISEHVSPLSLSFQSTSHSRSSKTSKLTRLFLVLRSSAHFRST